MTEKVLVDVIHDNRDPEHREAEIPVEYLRGSRPSRLEGRLANLTLAEAADWMREDYTTLLLWRGQCYKLNLTDKEGDFEAIPCSMGTALEENHGQTTN
jgi:putative hemolysin